MLITSLTRQHHGERLRVCQPGNDRGIILHQNVIAVSVAPRWVDMILSGRKTVELRRRGPGPECTGSRMLIYATRPRSALVATCTIAEVSVESPEHLWVETGRESGCTRDEFFAYFAYASRGTALRLEDIASIKGIPLYDLIHRFGWRPPVSWCWIARGSKLLNVVEKSK
jgi:predicted transcriptional regulator